jgi:hypothetical protein
MCRQPSRRPASNAIKRFNRTLAGLYARRSKPTPIAGNIKELEDKEQRSSGYAAGAGSVRARTRWPALINVMGSAAPMTR